MGRTPRSKDRQRSQLDPLIPDDPAAPEPRGKRGSYTHYLKARAILAERLQASPEEIAIWAWFGRSVGKDPAGGIDGYLDPDQHGGKPPRFHFRYDFQGNFDYLPQLMQCYFRADDLQSFQPADRYLTFAGVVERFKRFCGEEEGIALVRAKAASGDLASFHPLTGGTSESKAWQGEEGFPPLEQGMFLLSQVLEIEAECAPDQVLVSPSRTRIQPPVVSAAVSFDKEVALRFSAPSGGVKQEFVPLTRELEGWFEKPLTDLPEEKRQRVGGVFLVAWDQLTPEQRRIFAEQWDYQHDPAIEAERTQGWEEAIVDWRYWGQLPTLSAEEFCILRHVTDPRKFESERQTIPGGAGATLGQRVEDDLRRVVADSAVSEKKRLPLGRWVSWASKVGLICPGFMRTNADAASKDDVTEGRDRHYSSVEGITPKQFIERYAANVRGGKQFLDKWFKGKTRKKGEKPAAEQFRLDGSRGRYNESAMLAALKEEGRYSEIGH
ncbi:MAG: hypothetical protein A3H35_08425 [Betaproteobacteria bacterium RIFCSPLOWO2_02_FULL_62_17]|nr:MAG: hypothetical protein A3H35_08425 [Betaproteobacteria bacterium RIFCSPLOWO2_02_FULL_62_17]